MPPCSTTLGDVAAAPVLIRPLQPNQRPPAALSAASMPMANPPAVPLLSSTGATRLDTTISRPVISPLPSRTEGRRPPGSNARPTSCVASYIARRGGPAPRGNPAAAQQIRSDGLLLGS